MRQEAAVSEYSFIIPPDFDEWSWEWECKGYYPGSSIVSDGRVYILCFYDPVRLGQTIESYLQSDGFFFESNLVVVPSVTRPNLERAAEWLVTSGRLTSLVASGSE
jgi:hypothetical protein